MRMNIAQKKKQNLRGSKPVKIMSAKPKRPAATPDKVSPIGSFNYDLESLKVGSVSGKPGPSIFDESMNTSNSYSPDRPIHERVKQELALREIKMAALTERIREADEETRILAEVELKSKKKQKMSTAQADLRYKRLMA